MAGVGLWASIDTLGVACFVVAGPGPARIITAVAESPCKGPAAAAGVECTFHTHRVTRDALKNTARAAEVSRRTIEVSARIAGVEVWIDARAASKSIALHRATVAAGISQQWQWQSLASAAGVFGGLDAVDYAIGACRGSADAAGFADATVVVIATHAHGVELAEDARALVRCRALRDHWAEDSWLIARGIGFARERTACAAGVIRVRLANGRTGTVAYGGSTKAGGAEGIAYERPAA